MGFPVLRFDHPGAGDSAGSDTEGERVGPWTAGIGRAIDLAKTLGGCGEVLVVVRAGALLAAVATGGRRDVAGLALVVPCASGHGYLRELRALQAAMDLPQPPPGVAPAAGQEAAGFLFNEATALALEPLELGDVPMPPRRPVLLVERDDLPPNQKLARALAGAGADLEVRRLPGYAEMMRNPHEAVVPAALWGGIRAWLEARSAPARPLAPAVELAADHPRGSIELIEAPSPDAAPERVRDTPIAFGPEGRLFGILTEPVSSPIRRRTAILLVNPGSVHRVGCNRLWVRWARRWAALGYHVLRANLSGLGDSPPVGNLPDNLTYSPHGVADARHAVAELCARAGVDRVVVGGLCSGAYLAFHSALAGPPVSGVMLLNPVTFYFKPGMSLGVNGARAFKQTAHYKRAILPPDIWLKALRGRIDLRLFVASLGQRTRDVADAKVRHLLERLGLGQGADISGDMRRLVALGIDTLFVFAAGNPGLDYLQLHAPRTLRELCALGRMQVATVEATDHTFTPVWSQDRLTDLLTRHLLARHG